MSSKRDWNSIPEKTPHPSPGRAAIILAVPLLFITICSAADPASVTFSLDFPDSSPEHYSIAVQSDGHTHYESAGKITADSDVRDNYETEIGRAHV